MLASRLLMVFFLVLLFSPYHIAYSQVTTPVIEPNSGLSSPNFSDFSPIQRERLSDVDELSTPNYYDRIFPQSATDYYQPIPNPSQYLWGDIIPNITSQFDINVPQASGTGAEQYEIPRYFFLPDDVHAAQENTATDVAADTESIANERSDNFIRQYEHTLSDGTPSDQINLADTLVAGETSPDNLKRALKLYENAAQHKLDALHKAANILMNNPDLFQFGRETALDYWRDAAGKGYTPSIRGLGLAYRDGNGVPQDDLIAIDLLSRAYDVGSMKPGAAFLTERQEALRAREEADAILSSCAQRDEDLCPLVPVLYVTNRLPQRSENEIVYGIGISDELHFGKSLWAVPRGTEDENGPLIGRYTEEWRLDFEDEEVRHESKKSMAERPFFLMLNQVSSRLTSTARVMLYIHGFNNDFEDAAKRAAGFAYKTEFAGIPVIYSWPSLGRAGGYLADLDRQEDSCALFVYFLKKLSDSIGGGQYIRIVAHSMGAQLLFDALTSCSNSGAVYSEGRIEEIILAAPDVPSRQFERHADSFAEKARRVTIYVSEADWALTLSAGIRGSQPRLGMGGEGRVVLPFFETVDASNAGRRHSYVFEHKNVIADNAEILNDRLRPDCRAWTVPVQGVGLAWRW